MTAIIVGLTGAAGCGKDTAAFFMPGFQRYSLAGPIRAGLAAMFDLPISFLNDRETKETVITRIGKSPRQLMQTLGTEWGRKCVHPDLWVNLMLHRWEQLQSQPAPVNMVVTDVRFDNEATAIIKTGGTVWRIERPGIEPVCPHVSEAGVSSALIRGVIINSGSMADFRKQCRNVLTLLGARLP